MMDVVTDFAPKATHYKIASGKIWDVRGACFTEAEDLPAGAVVADLFQGGTPAGEDYLRRTLEFYGYPVGPELLTLDELKAEKLAEINAACDAALASLTADYPESELLTFDKQEAEARALIAAPDTSVPLLTSLAVARGIGTTELALRVIAKADAFTAASGHIIGLRQKYEDALDAAQTAEAVLGIVPEYALPGAG